MLSVRNVIAYASRRAPRPRMCTMLCAGVAVLLSGVAVSSAAAQCTTAIQAQQFLATKASEGLSNEFGSTVMISGNTAVVGTRYHPTNPGHDDGRVSVYVRSGAGAQWVLQQTLHPSIIASYDYFGDAVAIDGDTIVVGATANSPGEAYVFTRTGTVWTEQQILSVTGGYSFGRGIALLGDRLVVGDNGANSFHGRAHYYTRTGGLNGTWSLIQTLQAPSSVYFSGSMISMTSDTLAITESANNNGTGGQVRIFLRTGNAWNLQQIVRPTNQYVNDEFGFRTSLIGDTLLVGAPQDQDPNVPSSVNRGAAFVFSRTGTAWTQTAKIFSSNSVPNEWFGGSVALGNEFFAVIGAGGDTDSTQHGSAYTFRRTAGGGFWDLQNHLVPTGGGSAGDRIGEEVAVSGTSTSATVLVGASALSSNSKPAMYSFETTPSTFVQTQTLLEPLHDNDNLGSCVAIDGDWAVVGVPRADLVTGSGTGTATVIDAGEARVYHRVNGDWSQTATLTAPGLSAGNQFGYAVAISGTRIAVGTPFIDPSGVSGFAGAGMVYLYSLIGSAWHLDLSLSASDRAANDHFGSAVAMLDTTLVVGAPGDNNGAGTDAGAAYIYTLASGVWGGESKLASLDLAASDGFGTAVAVMSATRVVVSSPGDDDQGTSSGSAYLFNLQPIINGQAWTQVRKFVAADGSTSSSFGTSLAVSGSTMIAIGSPLNNTTLVDAGAVYVFTQSGINQNSFDLGVKVVATSGGASDHFGTQIALNSGTLIVGSPLNDAAGSNAGAAYVFRKLGGVWSQQQSFHGSDTAAGDQFGSAVGISGDTVVCGAPFDDNNTGLSSGSVYFFDYALTAPSVSVDPAPVSVCRRTNQADFFVGVAGGGPYSYVWRRNGVSLSDIAGKIAGSRTFHLTISNVAPGDLGSYTCAVSNPCSSVISGAAALSGCYADYDCSGTVGVQDIFAYLSDWFAGAPSADFNGVGGITIQDIFDFLTAWFVGC